MGRGKAKLKIIDAESSNRSLMETSYQLASALRADIELKEKEIERLQSENLRQAVEIADLKAELEKQKEYTQMYKRFNNLNDE